MATTVESSTIAVALVGNPNTGKSTLFSALAGVRQRVGNYPGVTVEKRLGRMTHGGQRFTLIDLPGTYSLAPRSPDEMVAVDVLLARQPGVPAPNVVLSIVDANNLERNLYLVSQVLELGLPTVVALNMTDIARTHGTEIDVEELSRRLGVPVVPIQANRRIGMNELKHALSEAACETASARPSPFPENFCKEVAELEAALAFARVTAPPRFLVERLLLDSGGYIEDYLLNGEAKGGEGKGIVPFYSEDSANGDSPRDGIRELLFAARSRLAAAGTPVPAVEAIARYGWVHQVLDGVIRRPAQRRESWTDAIDRVLTNKFTGTAVFAAMMLVVFSSIFIVAAPFMELLSGGVDRLGGLVEGAMPDGPLRSLLVKGVIGGVGAVVVFLPQIVFLFFFIALLEDCGYMARAAYLMDKLMVRAGLSGKSFIPLLSSFACAVPGIMATRVIENRRDRLTTILVAPLMSCSARLPVYFILIAAFIPPRRYLAGIVGLQGLTMFAMYLVGIVVAVVVALVLKRTILRGETPPFVMELPSYKIPSPSIVLGRMLERGWSFLKRAGTVIFAVTIVVWALTYYPRSEEQIEAAVGPERAAIESQIGALPEGDPAREPLEAELSDLGRREAALHQRYSYLGRAGQWIEPVVRPLGWDWRIGSAAIASFPAREVVMGVLGVIYNMGDDVDVGDEEVRLALGDRLRAARWDDTGEAVFNVPVALSLMVFFALCAQCAATLAVIYRETNSWRWPIFAFTYMTAIAYLGALITYQVGMIL